MTTHATDAGSPDVRRWTALAGPAAVAVSAVAVFGSVVLASWVLADWFTWTDNALSHLGEVGEPTAPLFNAGLVVSGLLGVAFAGRVYVAGTNAFHRFAAVLLGLGLANAALVGVFPLPHELHGPVAVAFFVLLTLGLFAHGSGDALAGRARRSVLSTWLAVAHVVAWVLLGVVPFDGIALPELVGVLALWIWTLAVYGDFT